MALRDLRVIATASDIQRERLQAEGPSAHSDLVANLLNDTPLQVALTVGALETRVDRQLYQPPNRNWREEEECLLHEIAAEDAVAAAEVEQEPPGVNQLLVVKGVALPAVEQAIDIVKDKLKVTIGTHVKRGYDIVRWGNMRGIAIFHARLEIFTTERQQLMSQVLDVLFEVSTVFNYNAHYVTMFYQKDALSRFIHQKLLFNIWPIEDYVNLHGIQDLRQDSFAYMYIYGLYIHKLGHFHDIVHGSRHDFYMNELRIEFLEEWIALLERHHFDPALMETSELGGRMLKQVVY